MRKYILALIIMVLVFNGFNNLREITDLAIVKVIGLDLTEDGNYRATALVLDTTKEDSNDTIMYEATGPSVQDAVRNIVDKSPKKLYLAHMETLIICENMAKEKLKNTMDFFIRDNEGSNNFFLLIAKDCKAKEAIEVVSKEKISMKELLLSSVKYKGNGNTNTLNDNIKDILRPQKDICVNVCSIEDEKICIEDMAYFKGWNMKGFFDEDESVVYNFLENNIENAIITVGADEDLIVAEIVESSSKISYSNGKIKVKLCTDLNISETGGNVKIITKEDNENVARIVENEIKTRVDNFITKCKNEYDVDVIGFGNLLYRKKIKNTDDIDIETEINVRILNQGGVMGKW